MKLSSVLAFVGCLLVPGQGASIGQNEAEDIPVGCMSIQMTPGVFQFVSPGGEQVCGMYMISGPDETIEVEFLDFSISCAHSSELAFVDGWELQGQYFPGEQDHPLPIYRRYQSFCGKQRPRRPLVTLQNAALLQFRVVKKGQGFRVKVTFRRNPEPCNVIALDRSGALTLSNHGRQINCSASILSPERIQILTLNIGSDQRFTGANVETGAVSKCAKRGLTDFVELLDGTGLDPTYMRKVTDVCGYDSNPRFPAVDLPCTHSIIRLVSSGRFRNSVTFQFSELHDVTCN